MIFFLSWIISIGCFLAYLIVGISVEIVTITKSINKIPTTAQTFIVRTTSENSSEAITTALTICTIINKSKVVTTNVERIN